MRMKIQKSNSYLAKKKVKMLIEVGPFKVGLEIRRSHPSEFSAVFYEASAWK